MLSIYHISTSSTRLSVYNCTPMPAPFPGALPCQDCDAEMWSCPPQRRTTSRPWLDHPHCMPGVRDHLGTFGTEQLARVGDRHMREVHEGRRGPERRVA
jgi:hypothetical protein